MKRLSVYLALALVVLLSAHFAQAKEDEVKLNDNSICAICVVVLTVLYRDTTITPLQTPEQTRSALQSACKKFSGQIAPLLCETIIDKVAERVQYTADDADKTCTSLGLCKTCHVYYDEPAKYYNTTRTERLQRGITKSIEQEVDIEERQMKARVIAALLSSSLFSKKHKTQETKSTMPFGATLPKIDVDDDGFSSIHMCTRCADWRGKDCNDFRPGVFPTRRESLDNSVSDGNCNGIKGSFDKATSYEAKFCGSNSLDLSLLFFGDSVTAGYGLPLEWFDGNDLSTVFQYTTDEMAWPSRSWASGYEANINQQSFYHLYRMHNRCAHRQYQNVAKNGAESRDFVGQVESATLTPDSKPVLATVAYLGNDACEMVPVEIFEAQFKAGMKLLNERIPPGSKVILFGPVDVDLIYTSMVNLIHPVGGVTYGRFYEFLSCLHINPCPSFLNSDPASRAAAKELSRQYDTTIGDIAFNSHEYPNMELGYFSFQELLDEAYAALEKEGKPFSYMIDPVDGFHPSIKFGHRLIAVAFWQLISRKYPHFLSEPNAFNEAIIKQFDEQGGH